MILIMNNNYILKMGSRLYEEFMKKLKVPMVQTNFLKKDKKDREGNRSDKETEFVICIPLKGGG
jgi:hypothetical protein